jgi:hypothetical protein
MNKTKTFSTVSLVEKHMESTDKKLTVKNFNRKNRLVIKHKDGSTIKLNNFFVEEALLSSKKINDGKPESVFIVYAEHFAPSYFMISDLRKRPYVKPKSKK